MTVTSLALSKKSKRLDWTFYPYVHHTGLTCAPKFTYMMYIRQKLRNINFYNLLSVAYTSTHYSKQPPVNVQLTGLMCVPKCKYVMYIRVETEKY
jgi:hypothetical protein